MRLKCSFTFSRSGALSARKSIDTPINRHVLVTRMEHQSEERRAKGTQWIQKIITLKNSWERTKKGWGSASVLMTAIVWEVWLGSQKQCEKARGAHEKNQWMIWSVDSRFKVATARQQCEKTACLLAWLLEKMWWNFSVICHHIICCFWYIWHIMCQCSQTF